MAKILLKLDGKVIREYSLKENATIGRKPDNDIVINNPAVSSHHCVIEKKGDVYTLEDLGSTNGTSVNEKVVRKTGLHQDDVIGVAKHQLVFLEDASHAAVAAHTGAVTDSAAPAPDADATMGPTEGAPAQDEKVGVVKILKGGPVNKEFEVKGNSMYIGKSDRAQIPIEGSGLFGSAPDVAASVHRKPEGFVLVAVEDGYPVVAGSKVSGKVQLKDGDIIECGSTTLQFSLKDKA
jgi:pSer/pThr/pTyr-binding forkhead associated (FHA) protein